MYKSHAIRYHKYKHLCNRPLAVFRFSKHLAVKVWENLHFYLEDTKVITYICPGDTLMLPILRETLYTDIGNIQQ